LALKAPFVSLLAGVQSKSMSDLSELQKRVVAFRDARDWKQFHTPKDLAISIAIEAGELMECFQWKSKEQVEQYIDSDKSFEIEEEMADILVYLLNLSDVLGIDLIKVANKKLDKNEAKYPIDKSKGNHKKYTEL
jgi:NTP pyrophosphatase (non-canonical NTP hydrolase)